MSWLMSCWTSALVEETGRVGHVTETGGFLFFDLPAVKAAEQFGGMCSLYTEIFIKVI